MHVAATPINRPYQSPGILHASDVYLALRVSCSASHRSNLFMTAAWYWHLRFKEVPLFAVILASWSHGICRILFGGAGEPVGQHGPLSRSAQDHARGHHP